MSTDPVCIHATGCSRFNETFSGQSSGCGFIVISGDFMPANNSFGKSEIIIICYNSCSFMIGITVPGDLSRRKLKIGYRVEVYLYKEHENLKLLFLNFIRSPLVKRDSQRP